MIAHLLLYSNKVFYISRECFTVSFYSYFFVRRTYNNQKYMVRLRKTDVSII